MAIALTKIYTRGGDKGSTALIGGERVSKASMRIEGYGTVDELNAALGLARSWIDRSESPSPEHISLKDVLKLLQNQLFDLGCDMATPEDKRSPDRPTVTVEMVEAMEQTMDRLNAGLPELKSFVLPGGGMLAAFLHQARTICRRAERIAVHLQEIEPIGEQVVPYLNRLSDLLFVLSREASRIDNAEEYLWEYR